MLKSRSGQAEISIQLWVDTEEAVRSQAPWNQTELKQFVKE